MDTKLKHQIALQVVLHDKNGFSGVITSGDIADSPVMKKMDDNRGLMIFRDASHIHIQRLTLTYFRMDLVK